MNKLAALGFLLIGLLFLIAGCSGVKPSSTAVVRTPAPAATPTLQATVPPEPAVALSPQPGGTATDHLSTCNLLNSRDVDGLFSTAEVVGPVHKVDQVNHLIFSAETISATESSCVYYVFHRPGKTDEKFLQVTYWLDVPDQATSSAWAHVGTDAAAKAAQTVPSVGGDAFYDNGLLTFESGDTYVTIGIVDTDLNMDSSAGAQQLIKMEKQIALDAQSRLAKNVSSQ